MKILVTGSTGFVGGALVRRLVQEGHAVRTFHRPTSSLRLLEGLDVEHAVGDLTQPETLEKAVDGIEVVFHTAAALSGRDDPGRLYAVTVEGTRALLLAAQAAGVQRVVHTSSVAALGIPESVGKDQNPVLMDENHTWNYRPEHWPYGYAKYQAEMEVQRAVARGLDVVIVNPSVVYGKGDIYRQSRSLVVQIARRRLPVVVEAGFNVVHIEDVVDGHLAAMVRGQRGERYILGGQNMMVHALIKEIAAIAGVTAPVVRLPVGLVRRLALPARWLSPFMEMPVAPETFHLAGYCFYVSTRKAITKLGLAPPRLPQEAVREAFAWFKEIGAI
ncbi:MAG: NAD-dependent epimerase/dehydratase family protein [Anaerolineaceae bacterium]|nr:NAD-dependent epimerase/dehydratase family protein [Anaerolineaceae bacterium]